MKTRLQYLIEQEQKQRSLRAMARQCGVGESNLSRYVKQGAIPEPKNLNKLATYFGETYHSLLEPINNDIQKTPVDSWLNSLPTIQKLAVEMCVASPPSRMHAVIALLHKFQEDNEQ